MRIEVENDAIRARKKQEYEDLVSEMDAKGYEARIEKINIVTANVFAMVLFVIVGAITFGINYTIRGNLFGDFFGGMNMYLWYLLFFVSYFLSIFVHEFIHGFFWHFPCEKKWGSIDFGLNVKMLTPYCHCREALNRKVYVFGAFAPTFFFFFIPIIIGLIINSYFVMFFGVIGFIGGAGDLMVIWTLRKHKDCMLFDHPYEVGYAYFLRKTGGDE